MCLAFSMEFLESNLAFSMEFLELKGYSTTTCTAPTKIINVIMLALHPLKGFLIRCEL